MKTFSSTVQPYLVDGTAVFVILMVWPFSKTGRRFVYKRYYRSKSKSKAVLRVNYGDGGTQGEVAPIDSVLTPATAVKKFCLEFWALTA